MHYPVDTFFMDKGNKKKVFLDCFGDVPGTHWGRFFEGVKNVKYLICEDIRNEADGTRTRNIQIDSLVL